MEAHVVSTTALYYDVAIFSSFLCRNTIKLVAMLSVTDNWITLGMTQVVMPCGVTVEGLLVDLTTLQ